ncbi:PAS domain S-box protein [Sphingomonas sp. TREG-RG-20F-R18-01]|uniref:PAS domain S-box protein n=1 Tax=Sphingomonas sp. TREG-RG-20F-R18-01 TaxID=2914982 RepID=UPI001F591C59|nr:PAS domain S-box protein [Sphingomonas sp. TREG-RG-20F-R18-01]
MAKRPDGHSLIGVRETADLDNLRLIVSGLREGVILLDPTGTILWANDAALAMHGVTTVDTLGQDAAGYRSRFALRYRNGHVLRAEDYPIERAVAGETVVDIVVEVTAAKADGMRWVHQMRSLILADQRGAIEGLVLIVTDITERAEAEHRFRQAFNANPAPALIARLTDLKVVRANQGFLDMTGYAADRIVGRTVYELDLFTRAERRDLAHERLAAGNPVPQMETEVDLPEGETKLVIVAGQPIGLEDEDCMLFTFADLEPRRKAETALRHSEERFQQAFDLAPVAMVVASLKNHALLEVNQAFRTMTGHSETTLVGRSPGELTLWDTAVTRRRMEEQVEATGKLRNEDAKVRTSTGQFLDCLVSAATIDRAGDRCVLWVIQDITERRQSELDLVAAIEAVMSDASWFSRNVVEKLANLRADRAGKPLKETAQLTRREREVLGHLGQGQDDEGIADALGLTRTTVRNHVSRIYGKIGVNKRGAAIIWARERGIGGKGIS